VLDWSALYLSRDHATGVAGSGLAFALFSLAMATMRFFGDALRNRVGAVPLLFASGVTGAAGLALAALAPSASVAMAGFVLTGIGLANMVPLLFSAAGRQGGANPGAAIAAISLIGYGGMLVAPTLLGVMAERVGFTACFLGLAAMLLTVALLSGRVAAPRRVAAPAAAD
jgi:MFS family permease